MYDGALVQQKRLLEQEASADQYAQENLDNRAKEQAKLEQEREIAIKNL